MTGLMEVYTADRAHIAHRGCECVECWHHARNRHDALAILRQCENAGGDSTLLGAVTWHVEERQSEAYRIHAQQKYGSIMEIYVGYRQ